MDLLEKINRSFGSWYEGLFGGSGEDVRPKDILRRILAALEDNRKEGFDNRVYVPNQYVLEINVHDEEEKEYLLSFLDRGELEAAIRRYCQQNHYHIRGPLDFTIKEVEDADLDTRRGEKVRVRCRYNTKITGPELPPANARAAGSAPGSAANGANGANGGRDQARYESEGEDHTVASVYGSADDAESGTVPAVAYGALVVYAPDRAPFRYTIARGNVTIGRSAKSNNDIVVETDGQISKRHARIELDADGRFTVYDLGSTNGTKVNGRRVENRLLNDGDEIVLGATRLVFQQSQPANAGEAQHGEDDLRTMPSSDTRSAPAPNGLAPNGMVGSAGPASRPPVRDDLGSSGPAPPIRSIRARTARLVLTDKTQDVDDFLLASETVIGRGVTNDIVLPDRSVATRHARILNDGTQYTLESLGNAVTTLNGMSMPAGHAEPLKDGDRISLGDLVLRFESGQM